MLNPDLEKRLLQFMKEKGEEFKSGVYLVGKYELFVAVSREGILIEDSDYKGVKADNIFGSLEFPRTENYTEILPLLPDFPTNFKYLCEDFVTTYNKYGRRSRGVPEQELSISNVFSVGTEKVAEVSGEESSKSIKGPWSDWIRNGPNTLVKINNKMQDSGEVPFFQYSVLQLSVILKYDSIALLVRKADGEKIVTENNEEDWPHNILDKLNRVNYDHQAHNEDFMSEGWVRGISAEYLLASTGTNRSPYHTTVLEQLEMEIWVGISERKKENDTYLEFCRTIPGGGRYLSNVTGAWAEEIRSELIKNKLDYSRVLKDRFAVPEEDLIHLIKNPVVWRY